MNSKQVRYTAPFQPARTVSLAAIAVIAAGLVAGCGGGSSSSGTTPSNTSTVAGSVTDQPTQANPLPSPFVGAAVSIATTSGAAAASPTTTGQAGVFAFPNVSIPDGVSAVDVVSGTAKVNGVDYSGTNEIQLLNVSGWPVTGSTKLTTNSNVNLVLSPTASQGTITGTVTDPTGKPLVGARVYAAAPYTDSITGTTTGFLSPSSFGTFTDSSGAYTLKRLPQLNSSTNPTGYTVTAVAYGYTDKTSTNQAVTAGGATSVNFSLASATTSPLQAITNYSATSITAPLASGLSRAAVRSNLGAAALKDYLLKRAGLLGRRLASRSLSRRSVARSSRAIGAGFTIENNVYWDYPALSNLYGYDVVRSTGDIRHFERIALLLDPLADEFSDGEAQLVPDTAYYYNVAQMDTSGNEFAATTTTTVAVEPLNVLLLSAPASGATGQSAKPTFSWSAVTRPSSLYQIAGYQVMLYSSFPTYQSDTNADGTAPIWTSAATTNTSVAYNGGTALVSGHTYYWAVVAVDSTGADYSLSGIRSFTVL